MKLDIQELEGLFTVCKVKNLDGVNLAVPFTFYAMTDEECSLVCKSEFVPDDNNIIERSDNWRGFRIAGILDFSLVGILAKISGILADNNISIFAVSTFNTDYIFVKSENFKMAMDFIANSL